MNFKHVIGALISIVNLAAGNMNQLFMYQKETMCMSCVASDSSELCRDSSAEFFCSYPNVLATDTVSLYGPDVQESESYLIKKIRCHKNFYTMYYDTGLVLRVIVDEYLQNECYNLKERTFMFNLQAEAPTESPTEVPTESPNELTEEPTEEPIESPPPSPLLPPPPPSRKSPPPSSPQSHPPPPPPPAETPADPPQDVVISYPPPPPISSIDSFNYTVRFSVSFDVSAACNSLFAFQTNKMAADVRSWLIAYLNKYSSVYESCPVFKRRFLIETTGSSMTLSCWTGADNITDALSSAALVTLANNNNDTRTTIVSSFESNIQGVIPTNFSYSAIQVMDSTGEVIPPVSNRDVAESKDVKTQLGFGLGLGIGLTTTVTGVIGAFIYSARKRKVNVNP